MKLMEERVRRDGLIENGDVLKVGTFLNQTIDVPFICECAEEFYRLFGNEGVTKILTIEASGIGLACLTAVPFGVPVLFAKKSRSSNMAGGVYTAPVYSFTHGTQHEIMVPDTMLGPGDRVLLIDDFLAKGEALHGLLTLCEKAGASVVGAGIFIEKQYQGGGDEIRAMGIRVESLAKIKSMSVEDGVEFC
ncbi:MAG: xanthine phosphoribosyltransferase [Clostridia bacterium]|nr:xanthine phosphoribosyltransferase [Clostridia bacterium]